MSPVVVQRPGFCRMTDVCCVKHQRQDFHLVDTERKQQSSSSAIQNSKSKAKATKSTADTKINAGLHGEVALQQHDWKIVATIFQSCCCRAASPFSMCFYCRLHSRHQNRKPQQLADKLMTASSLKSYPSVRRQAWQLPTHNQHLLIAERAGKQGGGLYWSSRCWSCESPYRDTAPSYSLQDLMLGCYTRHPLLIWCVHQMDQSHTSLPGSRAHDFFLPNMEIIQIWTFDYWSDNFVNRMRNICCTSRGRTKKTFLFCDLFLSQ